MLLSLGLCGITFSGADVGGFLGKGGGYGDPDAELFTRWFQAGAYQPFFRGHAHHDSARREPWTFNDATTEILRRIAMERYQLLAYWYTLFFVSEASGLPTMRPLWVAYPDDPRTWDMEKQFLAGGDLLVVPVTAQGATSVSVYFPGVAPWYDVAEGKAYKGSTDATVAAPIDKIPVFQRGGSIVPRQMRLRRSSAQMANDPFTLVVAPDGKGDAAGRLYLDPGDGYAYRQGQYAYQKYAYSGNVLTSSPLHASSEYVPINKLERVELLGPSPPGVSKATLLHGGEARTLDVRYAAESGRLVVRMPDVPMADSWTITLG